VRAVLGRESTVNTKRKLQSNMRFSKCKIRYQLWRSSEEVEGKPMILLVDQKEVMEMVGRIEHALEYVVLGGVEDANGAGGELPGWSALD
jgi:hypothetical protein